MPRKIKIKMTKKVFEDLRWKKITVEPSKWNSNYLTPREFIRLS